jgi:hypothetical protein
MSSNVLGMETASLVIIQQAISQSPYPINYLKSHCLANRYKYLAYKALQGNPKPQQGWLTARFLGVALKNDTSLIQKRVFWKASLKSLIFVLLPSQASQYILKKFSNFLDLKALLIHMKTNQN